MCKCLRVRNFKFLLQESFLLLSLISDFKFFYWTPLIPFSSMNLSPLLTAMPPLITTLLYYLNLPLNILNPVEPWLILSALYNCNLSATHSNHILQPANKLHPAVRNQFTCKQPTTIFTVEGYIALVKQQATTIRYKTQQYISLTSCICRC